MTDGARAADDPRGVPGSGDRIRRGVLCRGRGQEDRFVQQGYGVERPVRLDRHHVVVVDERDIEPTFAQRFGDRNGIELGNHELERGMFAAQSDERGRQQRPYGGGIRADPQRARQLATRLGQGGTRAFESGQHGLGVPNENYARCR